MDSRAVLLAAALREPDCPGLSWSSLFVGFLLVLLAPALLSMGVTGVMLSVFSDPGDSSAGKLFGELPEHAWTDGKPSDELISLLEQIELAGQGANRGHALAWLQAALGAQIAALIDASEQGLRLLTDAECEAVLDLGGLI